MSRGGIKLDDRDIKMLAILQAEGRISKAALAERVNLSPTPCWERLNRLEASGIIEGYGARIAEDVYGPMTHLFVMIEIENHRAEDFAAFEAAVEATPEIVECWCISGGFDYICKFVTRDLASYQRIIERLLETGAGVKRYFTYPAISARKRTEIPIEMIEETR
ncbi:transcriptional regulator, AsnC family [Fulvimarina manganoxydans]|uniref:Transcriptional regulator, AsnC family n=1 Tax=Fulvimarina manganoxydans TaxID=937218 RepID=A0A1W2E212_9HYPH|nr:Lrp/AsnC family transcriptional regulator [Fulvimarina manganoxydans]MCK5934323.1 Lrp/AsnC family transcriptional regulator [Fulvimarina manganoxydans]MEE2953511.1 Lrp/AsnC family transcriptional regulator [Pseudomonadota bacterium]SMD03813.1 transcriptional regulator, AsnC family [Fulvimarina manganoxydans]